MGRPKKPSKPEKFYVSAYISREMHEKLTRIAKLEDRPVASIIRRIIADAAEPELQSTGT